MSKNTVTLTNPDDVSNFRVGERRRIEDMLPEEAIAIFGLPVYENWLRHRNDPSPPRGTCTVTSIDRDEATITIDYGPLPSPSGSEGSDG